MTYEPPVARAAVVAAEKRFRSFFVVAVLSVVLLAVTMALPTLRSFWNGNRLWILGSLLVLASILHQRYFSVARNANPDSRTLPTDLRDRAIGRAETAVNHAWLLGFALLTLSRWLGW